MSLPVTVWRLVGNTPLICSTVSRRRVCVKLEYVNPTGSHKDRIAVYMIKNVFDEHGKPKCVVEASSGNTAIAVAWVARLANLQAILVVDKEASELKKKLIKFYGGRLIVADKGSDKRNIAREIAEKEGCVFLNQFANEANFMAHYEWTGDELLRQLSSVDVFVMGIGTGGTITGIAKRFKDEGLAPKVVGVVPKGSAIAGGSGGEHIEGLASTTIPELYVRRRNVIDEIVEVSRKEAAEGTVKLYRDIGVSAGFSTGAAYAVLRRILDEMEEGSVGLIIAADHIQRYLVEWEFHFSKT